MTVEKICGRIEFYSSDRGFGFVYDPNGVSRFFHFRNVIQGVPQVGARCIYEPGETRKGLVALNLQVLSGGA